MKLRNALALALLLGTFAQPLYAHRTWIITSSSVLSGEAPWITVDAAVSNNLFFPDHVAPPLENYVVIGPDKSEVAVQNGNRGKYRTTFDVELAKPGTYKIQSARPTVSASWEENGERKTFRGNEADFKDQNIADKPGVTVNRSVNRVETFVTSGEPTKEALEPTGVGLELSFEKTHPNDLFAGEQVTFILLKDGKPASDVEVTIVKGDDRYRSEQGEEKIKSGADGSIEFIFPEAGRYWINTRVGAGRGPGGPGAGGPAASGPAAGGAGGGGRGAGYSYTATFEVLPQ